MAYHPRCSVWKVGEERYAITPTDLVVPVIGYVIHNPDGTWSVESKGRVLRTTYPTQATAVEALLELERA